MLGRRATRHEGAVVREANAVIDALNSMDGYPADAVGASGSENPSVDAQLAHIVGAVRDVKPCGGGLHGEAALKQLLVGRESVGYGGDVAGSGSSPGRLAPYRRTGVARPKTTEGAPRL